MQSKDLEKIVVGIGVGKLRQNAQFENSILPEITKDIAAITGQKPQPRPAKQSIAGFKLREGNMVGLKVTLRGKRMRDFLARMVNVALPRVRDFRGIDPKQIDNAGNLTIGFREHTVFPEISPEESKFDFGFQVTLVSGTKNKEQARAVFDKLNIPFEKEEVKK
ncbi:MAG: 50S ribosomal protein L5 [Parcubacteria group bacterium GW2011_GWA1_47_11]|uniref:Large ribosomal subunit protein uL5 n=1 Tax=Candidatus Colwellbacteria bacterium GWA2_46_10 TaxID=1797684 RepID=A0A1G1YX21_9BACT|nr:MAG: 50S ribosomal protein L5 [Parcubacteria group bacterium GW2011_GWA2_46_10]KKU56376.1 MAG: 50S ribosomal protein L5 [Parcubacteria group bacterium GW2011_GWA1_47_11]OGY56935.1 MAG: 50S ribosomal protein L5 [Candidatus Colwellbacteria bacterium GWA2_46_10]